MQQAAGFSEPDWQVFLNGERVTIRPMQSDDYAALYAVASDPAIWEQHPEPTRWQPEVFRRFFDSGVALAGTPAGCAVVVRDRATGTVIGSSRWYDWSSRDRSVAIGYTFLARSHWGGAFNRDLKVLMLRHAMRVADQVWFHVGPNNERSKRALLALGATYSHTVLAVAGQGRDTAWFGMDRAQCDALFAAVDDERGGSGNA